MCVAHARAPPFLPARVFMPFEHSGHPELLWVRAECAERGLPAHLNGGPGCVPPSHVPRNKADEGSHALISPGTRPYGHGHWVLRVPKRGTLGYSGYAGLRARRCMDMCEYVAIDPRAARVLSCGCSSRLHALLRECMGLRCGAAQKARRGCGPCDTPRSLGAPESPQAVRRRRQRVWRPAPHGHASTQPGTRARVLVRPRAALYRTREAMHLGQKQRCFRFYSLYRTVVSRTTRRCGWLGMLRRAAPVL